MFTDMGAEVGRKAKHAQRCEVVTRAKAGLPNNAISYLLGRLLS